MSTKWWSSLFKIFLLILIVVVAGTELQSVHDLQQYKECSQSRSNFTYEIRNPGYTLVHREKTKV